MEYSYATFSKSLMKINIYISFLGVSCGDPGWPLNANRRATGFKYQDTVTYTCFSGYTNVSGSNVRTCQDDKSWSGTILVCDSELF